MGKTGKHAALSCPAEGIRRIGSADSGGLTVSIVSGSELELVCHSTRGQGVDKIKLLQFVTLFLIGGTERHLVNLVRGLDPSGFELYLACLKRIGGFLKELELRGIPICEYNINSLHNLNTLKEQFNFAAYLRRNQIQVVHSYGFYANVFAIPAARLAGTPVVVASIRDSADIR